MLINLAYSEIRTTKHY